MNKYSALKKKTRLKDDDNESPLVTRKQLKTLISRFCCSDCGQSAQLDISKQNLDTDIILKCGCEESENVVHSNVKEIENVNTSNIGEVTAAFVYQNILNGGGLAAMNNLTSVLGAKPIANSTYQRYKAYIEKLAEKKYNEMISKVDNAIFQHYDNMGFKPDSDGILDIEVMFDGTWMKRGFCSPIGMGIVRGVYWFCSGC